MSQIPLVDQIVGQQFASLNKAILDTTDIDSTELLGLTALDQLTSVTQLARYDAVRMNALSESVN